MRHLLTFLLMYITKKRGEKSFRKFEAACDIADEYSEKLLMELVNYGKDTEYGKKYHFDRIHNSSDFKRLVPIANMTITLPMSTVWYTKARRTC